MAAASIKMQRNFEVRYIYTIKKQMKQSHIFLLSAFLLAGIIFSSCKEKKNEDLTNEVNKNGAVETAVTVQHLDSTHDILLTKHTVWYKNNLFKNIEYRDTVPALGIENTTAENSDGDTKSVQVKKDYEIFITVK